MKTFKFCLLAAVAVISVFGFSSCQSERKMENYLLRGYCWEGRLPIYSYNEYYSRFFFEPDGTGGEEVYINGRYDQVYYYDWKWKDDSYGVLLLRYRGRWQTSYSCIDVTEINSRLMRGYFYEYAQDYDFDKANGFQYDRSGRYFVLQTNNSERYH